MARPLRIQYEGAVYQKFLAEEKTDSGCLLEFKRVPAPSWISPKAWGKPFTIPPVFDSLMKIIKPVILL
jgi:hypothetical protein